MSEGRERPIDRRRFLCAAGPAVLALLAACSGPEFLPSGTQTTPGEPGSATEFASRTGMQIGDEMPPIVSEAVEGPEVRLDRFRGQPFLLNFWASTCEPCRREFPLLRDLLERHSDFTIVGVAVLDRKPDAAAFAASQNATWPSIWDPDGSIATQFRVKALPVTYAVGRDFRLKDRLFGELDRNRLDSMVETILRS